MNIERGLSIISPADANLVVEAANRQNCLLYRISTEGSANLERFFESVQNSLPLDPPGASSRSWDALSDSIWGGIYSKNLDCVAILWPDATIWAEGNPDEFRIAISIFDDLAQSLSDLDLTVGNPTEVCIYVGLGET